MSTPKVTNPILAGLDLIDPCLEASKSRLALAKRLGTLSGRRIGLLDNRKDNADVILKRIAARLEQDFGATAGLYRMKPVYSRRAEPSVIEELAANSDFVVTSTGA